MCFSATASFVAGALLLPSGAATLAIAWKKGQRQKLPLAAAPLLFGLQQTLEGMVWLGIQTQPPLATTGHPVGPVVAALAYLFFAYVFWPVWRDPNPGKRLSGEPFPLLGWCQLSPCGFPF
jgi:hypothetical protein